MNKYHTHKKYGNHTYYAIARGDKQTITKSWVKCWKLVEYYPKPYFKACPSMKVARRFINNYRHSKYHSKNHHRIKKYQTFTKRRIKKYRQKRKKAKYGLHALQAFPMFKGVWNYSVIVKIVVKPISQYYQSFYEIDDQVRHQQYLRGTSETCQSRDKVAWLGLLNFLKENEAYQNYPITLMSNNKHLIEICRHKGFKNKNQSFKLISQVQYWLKRYHQVSFRYVPNLKITVHSVVDIALYE